MGEMEDTLTYNVKELYSFHKRATGYLKEEGENKKDRKRGESKREREREREGEKLEKKKERRE